MGGQDGCERRIEVFLKIKKGGGGGGSGGQGGTKNLNFCENSKHFFGGSGRVGSGRGVGLGDQDGCE